MRRTLVDLELARASPFGPYPDRLPGGLRCHLPSADDLVSFCHRWKVKELAIYGRVLEKPLPPATPIELMIGFRSGDRWLQADVARMEEQLSALFEHTVKLIERAEVDVSVNPVLRQRIFRSARTLFLEC